MADTYGTLAEADTYFADRGQGAWDEKPSDERAAALVRATSYIDARYAGRWKGRKAASDQDRAWPRTGVTDGDGYDVPESDIPAVLKHATFEAAYADLKVPGALYGTSANVQRIVRRKVGAIETQFADDGGASLTEITGKLADTMLAGLLGSSANISTSFLLRA
jgi:hypothetical protein